MHRSGTSILTRLLAKKDINFGRLRDDNDESKFFQRYNDYFLQVCSSHWDNVEPLYHLNEHPIYSEQLTSFVSGMSKLKLRFFHGRLNRWGFKDPRSLLFLRLWLKVFPEAKIVYITRNGIDVAKSLYLRSDKALKERGVVSQQRKLIHPFMPVRSRQAISLACSTIERAFDLWTQYQEIASINLKGVKHFSLRYEDLISNETELINILKYLDIPSENEDISNLFSMLDTKTKSSTYTDQNVDLLKFSKKTELAKYGY